MSTEGSARPDSSFPILAPGRRRNILVFCIFVVLILLGVLRSAIATRLDSFDMDEAFHITAGVSYVRLGDYRLNPEHPPLTKLWVGTFLTPSVFRTPVLRALSEKHDERHFTSHAVFLENDPDVVQRRSRTAMFSLNSILLLAFALTVWYSFGYKYGPLMAVAALLFLVIDPTVAAHLPLVLTDLPVSLLGATSVLLAWTTFRSGKALDAVCAGVALGLTLGAKHTGLIVAVAVAALGAVMLLRRDAGRTRLRRLAQVCAVLLLAWICLWGMYRFRFNESPQGFDLFNRPLDVKIADLHSPLLRGAVSAMVRSHLFPRSYLWGLADILHVGVEGRVTGTFFMGHFYMQHTPLYFFPTIVLAKIPIGLTAISILGVILWFRARSWTGREPLLVMLVFGALLMTMLALGTTSYAGMRHAQIVLPSFALAAAAAAVLSWEYKSRALLGGIAVATSLALLSAIPVLRPWEYYNEAAGGTTNAWLHLCDESSDSGQRTKEFTSYYYRYLKPRNEIPYVEYYESFEEDDRRGLPSMQAVWKALPETDISDQLNGTIFINACFLQPNPFADYTSLLNVAPTARFGNLLVFRGSFTLPGPRAGRFEYLALDAEYSENPDLEKAERYMATALDTKPGLYSRWIELGNIQLKRGNAKEALQSYINARSTTPAGDRFILLLEKQIQLVSTKAPKDVPPLRNPFLE